MFSFGIGSSVNRYLLDNMAKYGRGEVEYVALNDDGSAAARRFHERVRNPLLTDISIDWNGMQVSDVYPKTIPDLFSAKPVILSGRYGGDGRGVIRLRGKMSGRDFVREIPVDFSSKESHNVLATLWARTRIDDLMSQDFNGAQQGNMKPDVRESIVQLGLDYRLMTQFTSFVAVEEMIVTDGGAPRRIDVPVEVPEGVDRTAIFGQESEMFANPGRGVVSNNYARAIVPKPSVSTAAGLGTVSGKDKARRPRSGGGGGGGGTPPPPRPVGVLADVDASEVIRTLSPEEKKRADLQSKVHLSVLAVIDRLKVKNSVAGPDEAKFIRNGKAEVQIWLTEKTDENMAQLKALGFEVVLDPKSGKLVIGRLPIEKLAELAELKFVRYVAPQASQ